MADGDVPMTALPLVTTGKFAREPWLQTYAKKLQKT